MDQILWLVVGLAILTVVGHGIWVLLRALMRGLARAVNGRPHGPIKVDLCLRCGEPRDHPQDAGPCRFCGWSPGRPPAAGRPRPDLLVAQLRRRFERYRELGLLTTAARDRLLQALQDPSQPAAQEPAQSAPAASVATPQDVPAATAPTVASEDAFIESIETLDPAPHQAEVTGERASSTFDITERAQAYQALRANLASAAPTPTATPETPGARPQRGFKVLAPFLEEKNLRWGELVGGLLIVGCSLALVVSFWSSIAERPFLKYGLFNGVTALLFVIGYHAELRWKLPTTALGLLVIATLLTPLNFLAIASLVRGGSADSAWGFAGEIAAIVLFGVVVYRAGRSLVAGAPWTLVVGVLIPSASMLVVRRWMGSDRSSLVLVVLGALPMLGQATAIGGWISRCRLEPKIRETLANELLRLLGLSTFAAALVLGLLLAWSGPIVASLHRMTPLIPLLGASVLAPGLLLWRRMNAQDQVGYRTAGTAIAAAGTLVMLAGVVLAWPDPARMLPVALLNFAVLTAIAFSFEIPAAHVLAGLCLATAYLLGWLVAFGRLRWEVASSSDAAGALLSSGGGSALVPIVLLFGVVAATVLRRGRRLDAQAYAMAAALAGVFSLVVVTWLGFALAGDPAAVTWVYVVYAVAAFGFASWFGGHPLLAATNGTTETRVLGWIGSGLLLTALVQGLVFAGWPFALSLPWIVALLANSILCTLAAAWGWNHLANGTILREILKRSALTTSIIAGCGLVVMMPLAASSSLAARLLALAVIWLALAWRDASPKLFAAFQAALTGSVVFAVAAALDRQGWYVRSPHPWLDPWSLQAQGIAISLLALCWIVVRLSVRVRLESRSDPEGASRRAWPLLDPPWPAFDRYTRGAVLLILVALAVYGVVPGAAQELTPRHVAAQLARLPATTAGRVIPPIAAFEYASVPHAHALGTGSWVLLVLTVAVLLAGQWERFRRLDLLGVLVAVAMVAPLLAGRWETSVVLASALRWSSAVVLLAVSSLIWNRAWLAGWGHRLGWRFEAEHTAGLLGTATATAIALGMFPLLAMGAYVGTAVLMGQRLDPGVSQMWSLVAVLFVVLGAASLGLWRLADAPSAWARPGGQRAWLRPAGSLLVVLGTLPLVAVTALAVSAALVGHPIVGPEPGSFFARIGNAGSYVPPILFLAATLVGYAVLERSSSFAFAAGLVLCVAATVGYLMAGVKGGLAFDARLWIRLAQLNAIVVGAYALAWMGSLAAWRRRQGQHIATPVDGLLTTSVALSIALNLLVLTLATLTLLLDPAPAPMHLTAVSAWGFVAIVLAAAALVARAKVSAQPLAPDWYGLSLVCFAAFLALGLVGRDTGDWLAYHGVLVALALSGLVLPLVAWQRFGMRLAAVAAAVRSAVGRWSTVVLGAVVVFAIRAYWSDPQSPWWTIGGLVSMAALAAILACWSFGSKFLVLASVLLNLGATFLWFSKPVSRLGLNVALADGVNVNIIALALPAPVWLWIERRVLRVGSVPFQRVASWIALSLLSLVVLVSLAEGAGQAPGQFHALLGWAAVAAAAFAMAAGLWDAWSRASVAGLYLLGLCASGWTIHQLQLPPNWLLWTATMVLSAYSVATSYLWSRRAALRDLADRVGIPRPDVHDPVANLSWLVPANLSLAALVLILACGTILTEPELFLRTSSALAASAEGLAIGLLAHGARRSRLQGITMLVVVVGAVAWGWARIAPDAATGLLDRLAVLLAVLVGASVVYGLGLTKLLPTATEWALAARRLVPTLLGLGGVALTLVSIVEVFNRFHEQILPMSGWAVAEFALTLLGAAVAALIAALVPGRDPLGLSERGRTAYVYGCEILLAVLVVHLALTLPWLFSGFLARYWSLIILGLAFLGVGLSELFRRQGRLLLAEPLENTGALLPVLPLLVAFWTVPKPGEDVLFLVLVGVLYTTLSLLRSSLGFGALAALACNAALWAWLGHRDGLSLMRHPQLWVVFPALCVLVGASLNRDRLSNAQLTSIRYAASLAIYLASTADIILTGVAQAPWLPLVLAALSIAGIFAGIVLRIRGFLFLGLGFLMLSLFSIIWYAAVDLHQTWLWAASGIVVGILVLALFALFEKKRLDVLRLADQIREWNP